MRNHLGFLISGENVNISTEAQEFYRDFVNNFEPTFFEGDRLQLCIDDGFVKDEWFEELPNGVYTFDCYIFTNISHTEVAVGIKLKGMKPKFKNKSFKIDRFTLCNE
jgi:hypothetical protein